jgi:acetylornithine deacetylase/succinyl-diaminopimelate desuccinylase-like protein
VQGPILAFIYAVKEMLEEGQGTDASLPVNVAFVFEGEEENGTLSLPQHLSQVAYVCVSVSLTHKQEMR